MKIVIVLIVLFFAIPTTWFIIGFYIELWKKMFEWAADGYERVIRYISIHLPTIHLNHYGAGGTRLIWDNVNKTMYGHPEGVESIKEE